MRVLPAPLFPKGETVTEKTQHSETEAAADRLAEHLAENTPDFLADPALLILRAFSKAAGNVEKAIPEAELRGVSVAYLAPFTVALTLGLMHLEHASARKTFDPAKLAALMTSQGYKLYREFTAKEDKLATQGGAPDHPEYKH